MSCVPSIGPTLANSPFCFHCRRSFLFLWNSCRYCCANEFVTGTICRGVVASSDQSPTDIFSFVAHFLLPLALIISVIAATFAWMRHFTTIACTALALLGLQVSSFISGRTSLVPTPTCIRSPSLAKSSGACFPLPPSRLQAVTAPKSSQPVNLRDTSNSNGKSVHPIFNFSINETISKFERLDDAIMGGISTSSLRNVPNRPYAMFSGVCRLDGGSVST